MNILIADDASTMGNLLFPGLSRQGYEVEEVASGEQVWTALQKPGAVEIAKLDWTMPGMTGLEVCQKLRERPTGGPSMSFCGQV